MAVIFPDRIKIDKLATYKHRPTGRTMRVLREWVSPGGMEFVRLGTAAGDEWSGWVDQFWREWINEKIC